MSVHIRHPARIEAEVRRGDASDYWRHAPAMTLAEVAALFGTTQQTIQRIEKQALAKIRAALVGTERDK